MTQNGRQEFHLKESHRYNHSGAGRWILSHIGRYPHLPLTVILTAVVNNFAYSVSAVYVGRGFDLITTEGWQTDGLLTLALYLFGAAMLQAITAMVRNYANEFLAQLVERNVRDELYVSLLGKSQTFHGRQRVGDVMARATNDVRALYTMFSPGLLMIIDATMGAVAPFVLIGLLKFELLLVPAIFFVIFGFSLSDYARRLGPVSIALRDQFGRTNAGLNEAITGIEVVKSNVQEQQEIERFSADARLYRDYFVQEGRIQARYLPMLVLGIGMAAGFAHALALWQAGTISLGEVVAYMGLFRVLRFPTFVSIFSFTQVQLGMASARRILGLMKIETELDDNEAGLEQPIKGGVTFENVTFGYDPAAPVLREISFSAEAGETVAIVGETGAGKTTLTQLINRIFDVDRGRVLVDGVDVRQWKLASLRAQISTIEQDVILFSGSISENIAFGRPEAAPAEIAEAAGTAQAAEFIDQFPGGYQTEIGERGVTLSGGQRQRLAIARAFLTRPQILILDDSTSAIDSATEDKIQRAIRRISRRQTTFLITHRLSQIRWADRILVLNEGRLVDQGSHEELIERCVPYRQIFSQYEL